MNDPINNPAHYAAVGDGRVQPIDLIESQGMEYRQGNIIKYVSRYKYKGMPLKDLKKARWYLDRLIAEEEAKEAARAAENGGKS